MPDDPAFLVPSYFLGIQLGTLLGDREIRPVTIANYLQGLVSLMRHGGGDPVALEGIRSAQQHYVRLARRVPKFKVTRIRSLMENGGFGYILQRVTDCQRDANALPRYSALRFRVLQAAAILVLMANKPARTGDVAHWRLGHELTRDANDVWSLRWTQMKTGHETGAGELWPETCQVLDRLLLQDKPARLAQLVYTQLRGKNWLTHHPSPPADTWPSMLVCEILGAPLHDLRTLSADYIRRYDPANAPGVIQSHLGHRSTRAGEEYRALAEGDAAAESWRSLRGTLEAIRRSKA
uniref:Integrase n=1 Tax=Alloyangia mangrovi TaxID=1779329 RepID=A0A2A3K0G3_9RHOB